MKIVEFKVVLTNKETAETKLKKHFDIVLSEIKTLPYERITISTKLRMATEKELHMQTIIDGDYEID